MADMRAGVQSTEVVVPVLQPEARRALQFLLTWLVSAIPALTATSEQYSWSLLLFVGPALVLVPDLRRQRRLIPVVTAAAVLTPMGLVLTWAFASEFFIYPNLRATVGLAISGHSAATPAIPVEEFLFYIFGFLALLIVYAWADEVFLPRGTAPARMLRLTWRNLALGIGAGLVVGAGGLAAHALSRGAGFPGYWLYLAAVPVPFVAGLAPALLHRVNWPALALMALGLWGHSIFWEVSLAVPQGWWGYQRDAMVGLFIPAWHDFPIEGVLVWVLTPAATVLAYELVRAWRRS